jgi:protein-S-isoprenylcysteine O-methyltransferase Ste14
MITGQLHQPQPANRAHLLGQVAVRVLAGVPVLLLLIFLPAGTWSYWQAWVYLGVILVPMLLALGYLLKYAPDLLERRMKAREQESTQRRIIALSLVYFLVIFTLPGLDVRFGWSHVPAAVVIVANGIVLVGYGIFFLVLRENRYAARVVQVEQGQTVISSGPYAVVRHPMYVGVALMYVFSPLALGSYWAMLPALLMIPLLMTRIRNEESVLLRDLPGYATYKQQVKYRLLPGVW